MRVAKMTQFPPRLLIIVASAAAGFTQSAQAEGAPPGVTATAEITDQKFCLGMSLVALVIPAGGEVAPDAISLHLRVRVTYRNQGATPIILQISNDGHIVLSGNLEGAARHRHQVVIPDWDFEPRHRLRREDFPALTERPDDGFEVLPPGGAWADEATYSHLSFQVHKPAPGGTGRELLGKKVFLQLDLDHALLGGNLAHKLQSKWRSYGTLWAGRVRTQPVELDIPESPRAFQCKPEGGL
jgi:hypothetical protein